MKHDKLLIISLGLAVVIIATLVLTIVNIKYDHVDKRLYALEIKAHYHVIKKCKEGTFSDCNDWRLLR